MKADLIVANGRIRPLGRAGLRPRSHLAISRGRVIAVGGPELMDLRGPRTHSVDLTGATVLPGFNDAHAHVVYHGLTRFAADLGGVRSVGELQAALRRHALHLQPGEWQHGLGYRSSELVERRPPHRMELDAVTGRRAAFIDERGGHSRVANSAALAAAGIDADTPDPPGGGIGRDAGGAPNGLLLETAMRLVADVQPMPSLARRIEGIRRTQGLLLSRGITSVGAAVNRGFADDLRAYQTMLEAGQLRIRVNQFLSWELLDAATHLGVRHAYGGPMLRAGPIKVFIDGGAERIAMRGRSVTWRTDPSELQDIVGRATGAGLQVAAHAIGDAAIEAMCDAVEGAGGQRLRHRVEHCTVCPPDLRRRLAKLGMVAVMQPLVSAYRGVRGGLFDGIRGAWVAPHRALLAAGVPLVFSSDLPVIPDPDPWPGIRAAVGDAEDGVAMDEALAAYTSAGAYASFEERTKGTLEPGMWADLQVYDSDPLKEELRPRVVLVGGVPVVGRLS